MSIIAFSPHSISTLVSFAILDVSIGTISSLGLAFTNTTNLNPCLSSYRAFNSSIRHTHKRWHVGEILPSVARVSGEQLFFSCSAADKADNPPTCPLLFIKKSYTTPPTYMRGWAFKISHFCSKLNVANMPETVSIICANEWKGRYWLCNIVQSSGTGSNNREIAWENWCRLVVSAFRVTIEGRETSILTFSFLHLPF